MIRLAQPSPRIWNSLHERSRPDEPPKAPAPVDRLETHAATTVVESTMHRKLVQRPAIMGLASPGARLAFRDATPRVPNDISLVDPQGDFLRINRAEPSSVSCRH